MKRLLCAAALGLSACGPPAPAVNFVDGEVNGIGFSGARAIYGKESGSGGFDSGRVFILISKASDACERLTSTGFFSRSGVSATRAFGEERIPSLYLQVPDPEATWATRFSLGNGAGANLDDGKVVPTASLGTIDIDRWDDLDASGARAQGTFNVGFDGAGAYTGSFDAKPCKVLVPGCSASGAGALAPLLALLALLRRRRR
jgi:uncharacterized protein (TIGR03382 family)